MFRLDQNAFTGGTHLLDVIHLPPAFVVARFGLSERGERGRCTGHWTFVSDRGEVFTLYESRSTSATCPGAIPPYVFWRLMIPMELHIGGLRSHDLARFRQWLVKQYRQFQEEEHPRIVTNQGLTPECVLELFQDLPPADQQTFLRSVPAEEVLKSLLPEDWLEELSPAEIKQLLHKLTANLRSPRRQLRRGSSHV